MNMNQPNKSGSWKAIPVRASFLSLLLLGSVGYMAMATPPSSSIPSPPTVQTPLPDAQAIQGLERSGQVFSAIAKRISPAVVSLKVEKKADAPFGNAPNDDQPMPFGNEDLLKRFFGGKLPEQFHQRPTPNPRHGVVGQGSGFIVSSDGFIMTNNHVVGDTTKVMVKFSDGRELPAKVIGGDAQTDVAVLKVDATNLTTIPFGDSTKTEVGEWVLAMGAPYGLTQTLTAGIVSAVGRNSVGITDYENFIQTDAAINPGNSGGPLVNLRGEVIGINTAIFSRNGGSVGLGFAIPIDMARNAFDQISQHGSVVRSFLGVRIQGMNQDMADHFGIKDSQGVLVGEVVKGAPGEKAGLKQADIITELDGRKVADAATLRNAIAMKAPGTKVHLTVLRDGQRMDLPVTLEKLTESAAASVSASESLKQPTNSWGLAVQPLTSDLAKKFGFAADSGVVITEVTPVSPASEAGLEPGMLIQQVNRRNVRTTEEFNQALKQDQDSKSILLLVSTPQGSRFVILKAAN